MESSTIHRRLGVRRVLNATATWTDFGASVVDSELAAAVAEGLQNAFVIEDLQEAASERIARATGSEAGFVTNCTAAGLVVAAAACIAGTDPAKVRRLPRADWPRREIVLQKGHAVDFGADVAQMLRLSGADVVEAGSANWCEPARLRSEITERTAAGVFVVSDLCTQRNLVLLPDFCAMFHEHGIPVIVDAATESDTAGMHRHGADLVIQSLQKFPQGPTAGIISGRKDLIAAIRAQLPGMGRPMKAPKEAIVGTILTLDRMTGMDRPAIRARDRERLRHASLLLADVAGLTTTIVPDPIGNPFDRLEIRIEPVAAGMTATELARRLLKHDPVVATRDAGAEHGYLLIDPRSLTDEELTELCNIVRQLVETHIQHPQSIRCSQRDRRLR